MATRMAKKAMKENIAMHVSASSNPATYNLCVAILSLAETLDELDAKIADVSKQVAQLARLQAQRR